MSQVCYSVVIPAYNCREPLHRLLDELKAQTYAKENFDVLVVDDGSTDDTAEVGKQAGAQVFSHSTNLGRVQTRETGAKQAKHETLVFIDARVSVRSDLLEKISELKYLPLMGVGVANKKESSIDRVFYCMRKKIYRPYEPQSQYAKELWLKKNEFDGRPKGTGLFIIDRKMFLDLALEEKGQDVSDDTLLLRKIVTEGKPILRHTDLSFYYEHRHRWPDLLKHTFFRGPKFLDYYLVPGGPYFNYYMIAWLLFFTVLAFSLLWPSVAIGLALFCILGFAAVCTWMSEDVGDFFTCLFCFPPIAGAFISGILFAQFSRLFGMRSWVKH